MEPNDLPIVCLPLELSGDAAEKLIDFLYQLIEALERHAEREERLRRFVQEALVGGDVNPRKFGVERRIRRERDQDRRRGERRRGLG